MLYYNRQIIYIDYMEAGSKVKNAGFLRKEETEDTITWNMQIKGLYETDTGFFDLRDETGALIDKVLLKRGTGSYERQFTAGGVSRGGRDFGEICGISIRLSPGREVIGRWKGREKCLKAADISVTEERTGKYETPETVPYQAGEQRREALQAFIEIPEIKTADMEEKHLAAVKTETDGPDILQYQKPLSEKQKDTESADEGNGFRLHRDDVDSVMENGAISAEKLCRRCMHKRFTPQEKKRESESKKAAPTAEGEALWEGGIQKAGIPGKEGIPYKEGMSHKEEMSRNEGGVSGGNGVPEESSAAKGKHAAKQGGDDLMQEEFFEDKWEQLRHMYPTVHPFADERQYLSITPRDFVILCSEYQKMVRNSFLLHGYYNYRHIILGKFNVGGVEKFYLGVPGVYYDREKMAAEMFGFEAFEGKQTPAEPGSFGYYMKSVRI